MNDNTHDDHRGSTRGERMYDHITRAVTVAALLWMGSASLNTQKHVAVIQTEIKGIYKLIGSFDTLSSDRYTGSDARRELAPLVTKLEDHEQRLRRLERPNSGSPQ